MSAQALHWHAPPVRRLLAAQLCAALADNALLIVAIGLLEAQRAPSWITPTLRIGFYACYVLLAPFAGRWADIWPKPRLMGAVNGIKLGGVIALALGAHPLLVFAVIGCGAAAYAPARYGMLPELIMSRDLIQANAAMEIVTIVAIIGGYLLGSVLVGAASQGYAYIVLGALYALGAAFTLAFKGGAAARGKPASFSTGVALLLNDVPARDSLALTSIFWAAAAVLQFVLLDWARHNLEVNLAHAAMLNALFAIGMIGGAVLAGVWKSLAKSGLAAVCGIALAISIVTMPLVRSVSVACVLLLTTGLLAGALLVPMNATLQQRGATLMLPGLSVAVQNFFENGLSIVFLSAYGIALVCKLSPNATIYGLGVAVLASVCLNLLRGRAIAAIASRAGNP